jgi:putative Holliday junction resolvase
MSAERAVESNPPARVLGFDVGQRRIGVAAGQALTGTAQALTVVPNGAHGPDWPRLEALVREWRPEALVVGRPLTMAGEEQPASQAARGFARALARRFGLPVHDQDERLSSREADERFVAMRRSGQKRARDAAQLDALAAQVIVEDFYAGWHQEAEHAD